MGADLDPWMGAERRRLEQEVARAEAELLDAEVVVETLRVELARFAHAHHRRLGALYHRLDELDAELAEAVALRTGDPDDQRWAAEARARVAESEPAEADSADSPHGADSPDGGADRDGTADQESAGQRRAKVRIRPSKQAQRLYRELARRAHPDLAQDPAEKARREQFIRRVNDAYADGDIALLERLSDEWAIGPDAAPAVGTPERIEWLRTRLGWLQARLAELRAKQAELEASPIGQLLTLDPADPEGLLDRLGEQLAEQIQRAEERLRRVHAEPPAWPG